MAASGITGRVRASEAVRGGGLGGSAVGRRWRFYPVAVAGQRAAETDGKPQEPAGQGRSQLVRLAVAVMWGP